MQKSKTEIKKKEYREIYDTLVSLGIIDAINKQLLLPYQQAAVAATSKLQRQVSRYHVTRLCRDRGIFIVRPCDIINIVVQREGLLRLHHDAAKKESAYKLSINDKDLAILCGHGVKPCNVSYWRYQNNILPAGENHGGARVKKTKVSSPADIEAAITGYKEAITDIDDRRAQHYARVLLFGPLNLESDELLKPLHVRDVAEHNRDRSRISYVPHNDKLATRGINTHADFLRESAANI